MSFTLHKDEYTKTSGLIHRYHSKKYNIYRGPISISQFVYKREVKHKHLYRNKTNKCSLKFTLATVQMYTFSS